MIFVHVLGGALVLTGIALFIREQLRETHEEQSQMQMWKINVSAPPAFLLILFGAAVFLFPFSPWWNESPPEATTQTTEPGVFAPLPQVPTYFDVYHSDECGGNVIEWEVFGDEAGWIVDVEVFNPGGQFIDLYTFDTAFDLLTFGNAAGLCEWDFVLAGNFVYDLYVYPYNQSGSSETGLYIPYDPPAAQG